MNTKRITTSMVAALLAVLSYTQAHAFTAQLPITGYQFIDVVNIVNHEVGALTSVYTVPEGRIVVITDVYITLSSGASGNHTIYIADNSLNTRAGPFRINDSTSFSKSYTSGIILIAGQQIIISDTGGVGAVTVNLVGYTACAEPCS